MQISIKTAQAHQNTCCVVIRSSSLSQQSLFFSYQTYIHTCSASGHGWWGRRGCGEQHTHTNPKPSSLRLELEKANKQPGGALVMAHSYWHQLVPLCRTNHAWGHLRWRRLGGQASGELRPSSAISKGGQLASVFYMGGKRGWAAIFNTMAGDKPDHTC